VEDNDGDIFADIVHTYSTSEAMADDVDGEEI
jgi:hypothetical protein